MTLFFDLVVDRDLTDGPDTDAVYEAFDHDVTPAVTNGVPVLMFSVEATSVEDAIRPIVSRLRAMGIAVLEVRFEPDAVLT